MKGLVIILSGPSGVGKDTVIDAWKLIDPDVERVIAYTTRSPRPNESDGIDYHFVSRSEFESMIQTNKFLEHKEVHGQFYGTPIDNLNQMVTSGKTAILKIDVQGALEVMEKRPDAISIFIMPPSKEELEHRLRSRKTEPEEKLQIRLKNAEDEMKMADRYDYRLVNDTVESLVQGLIEVKGER